ncbi:unnamed protein product [Cuscuta epithymum]|uniref:Uncharacterized protein n=1 Tax=Cuscuta epithymum TaxID=186058 RepID=A0AAV0DLW3_9ASTE|nr:unnamed protein product [Cuscuta epithymum]
MHDKVKRKTFHRNVTRLVSQNGWKYQGVDKAIIMRNGWSVTMFTAGTNSLFEQRVVVDQSLPKLIQWHRIGVHNDMFGSYVLQQLNKNFMFMLKQGFSLIA